MSTTTTQEEHRSYGGWRISRGVGLLGMGPIETIIALGCVFTVVVSATFSLILAAILILPTTAVIGAMLLRIGGVPLAHSVIGHVRWWVGRSRGQHLHSASIVTVHEDALALPGVLAPLELISAEDGFGGKYGLIWDRRSGCLTATINVAASSTWLAAAEDANAWVDSWGSWLASLGYQPLISHVAVTIDTAPDPGSTLVDHINARMQNDAPEPALQLMHNLVAASPAASADVDTRISLTFNPAHATIPLTTVADAAAEIGRTLTGVIQSLGSCGVSVQGRTSAAEIAGIVRTAFDPHARGEVNRLMEHSVESQEELLSWSEAGPIGAEEFPDRYEHDSGVSVAWAWKEAPRQDVTSTVLTNLIAPGAYPKRVTLLYRPYSAAQAGEIVQQERSGTHFRAQLASRSGRDATARDTADREHAERQAAEEAHGAGVCRLGIWVTTTVTDPDDLLHAVSDIESRADTAKIRLRRLYRGQAAGFATTLPVGIYPPLLAKQFSH